MFIPIVVFSNRAKLRVQTQETVINLWRLRSEIKKHKTPIIPSEQLIDYRSSIELAAIDDKDIAKSHKANVRQNLNQRTQAIANGLCPRCGGHLVKRNGRCGSFYGCSNYPNCKFTMKSWWRISQGATSSHGWRCALIYVTLTWGSDSLWSRGCIRLLHAPRWRQHQASLWCTAHRRELFLSWGGQGIGRDVKMNFIFFNKFNLS